MKKNNQRHFRSGRCRVINCAIGQVERDGVAVDAVVVDNVERLPREAVGGASVPEQEGKKRETRTNIGQHE